MKKSLLVLALLFSLVSFAQSPADKSFPPEELFALGSYYYPEQWDSSQWERDLKKCRRWESSSPILRSSPGP